MNRTNGPTIGETVRLWQEFMARNGSPVYLFWRREVLPTCRCIAFPVLLSHDEKRFIKGRKIRPLKPEEL